ncbi:MAG: alpha-2-macroglobulin family protein, partial [Bacteroidota bacterium]
IDKNENLVNTKARIQLVRYRWQTVLERDYAGNLNYQSRKKEEIVEEREILISPNSLTQQFIPKKAGQYAVRLRFLKNNKHFVSQNFYVNGYSYAGNSSLRVNKVGDINIKLDKEKYQVGEPAKLLFSTPFNGKMLVTIEQDQVFQHFYLNTENKTASTTINITEEHLPNIYISATLIKPVSDGAIPLTVAHGYQSLMVEKPSSRFDLAIEAPQKSESQRSQVIKVKTQRPESDIQVSIAVVDEGILQIKNFQTPDPHGFFYQKRKLDVNSYDLYPQLFPEITLSTSSTGGGGADLGLRTNPMVNKRVKLVSYWSGILKTNAQGEVNYKIDIPEFSGSLRVMAVAYKNGAFGSARHSMKVADPIVISTGLPRFLSPGDKVKVPVSLSNTTEQDASAEVSLTTSNNLSISGKKKNTIQIKKNSEKQVEFEIEAAQLIDSAQVNIRVNALGRIFTQKIDINIRPTVGLVKKSGFGEIKAGSSKDFSLTHDFLPVTTKAKLVLGKSPMVQFSDNLDYLIRYPYGCLEQITSSVFPQLYVQDLMEVVQPGLQNASLYQAEIRENVQEGLMRLLARQNYDGGLSYWPGGESSWFGTAYAAHFMIEARDAGYFVDQSTIDLVFKILDHP